MNNLKLFCAGTIVTAFIGATLYAVFVTKDVFLTFFVTAFVVLGGILWSINVITNYFN
jgi:hypothetical protein